jgi:hypothetical protein
MMMMQSYLQHISFSPHTDFGVNCAEVK